MTIDESMVQHTNKTFPSSPKTVTIPLSIQAQVNDANGLTWLLGEILFILFMRRRGVAFGVPAPYTHTPLNAQNFPLKTLTLPYLPLTGENV